MLAVFRPASFLTDKVGTKELHSVGRSCWSRDTAEVTTEVGRCDWYTCLYMWAIPTNLGWDFAAEP